MYQKSVQLQTPKKNFIKINNLTEQQEGENSYQVVQAQNPLLGLLDILGKIPFILMLIPSSFFFFFASLNVYTEHRRAEWDESSQDCMRAIQLVELLEVSVSEKLECPEFTFINVFDSRSPQLSESVYEDIIQTKEKLENDWWLEHYRITEKQEVLKSLLVETQEIRKPELITPQEIQELQTMSEKLDVLHEERIESLVFEENRYKFYMYKQILQGDPNQEQELPSVLNLDELYAAERFTNEYVVFLHEQNKQIDDIVSRGNRNINVDAYSYFIFSPQEFVLKGDRQTFQKEDEPKTTPLIITGNEQADRRIRILAESRGYKIRLPTDENRLVNVSDGRLNGQVALSWENMRESARKEGVILQLTSGYRSLDDQRFLFLERLNQSSFKKNGKNLSPEDIIAGVGDQIIIEVLENAAPPGYSKHHSGFAIDIGFEFGKNQPQVPFRETLGFQWLSKDNYYNAKRFGFVPSYPENAQDYGPEPESWEYIWVGEDGLKIETPKTKSL